MNKNIIIIGAGGHLRSLINLLDDYRDQIIGIVDESYNPDAKEKEIICGFELVGDFNAIRSGNKIILAVGDIKKREEYLNCFSAQVIKENLIHRNALIENKAELGEGNQLFGGVIINSYAKIGNNNIINTKALIEHESRIGSHCHISVGSIICGRASVGDRCFIGAGSVVIDKIKICDDVTIGANSVIIEDINKPGIYAGNPAKKIK